MGGIGNLGGSESQTRTSTRTLSGNVSSGEGSISLGLLGYRGNLALPGATQIGANAANQISNVNYKVAKGGSLTITNDTAALQQVSDTLQRVVDAQANLGPTAMRDTGPVTSPVTGLPVVSDAQSSFGKSTWVALAVVGAVLVGLVFLLRKR